MHSNLFFSSLPLLPKDPILGLRDDFHSDNREGKINVGIGVYRTEEEKPYVLSCVRKAEEKIFKKNLNKEYTAILGDPEFLQQWLSFLFPSKDTLLPHLAAAQTIGGTGALRLTADLLLRSNISTIYLPEPTWPNHPSLFSLAGFEVRSYPYYNREKNELSFDALLSSLEKISSPSAILLHGCCHNPTGADLSLLQWNEVVDRIEKKHLIPVIDMAYHGFGENLKTDFRPVEILLEEEFPVFFVTLLQKTWVYMANVLELFLFFSKKNNRKRLLNRRWHS